MAKKKKQGRALAAGLGVLAVLIAVEVGLNYANKKAEEAETEETEGVNPLSISSEDLTRVTVTNRYGTFSMVKGDESWSNADDADFPLDEDAWTDKIGNLDSLAIVRTLDAPDDLSEYGLDDPAVTLTLATADGETTLYIGNENASTGDYYVYVDEPSFVYTVNDDVAEAMDCKLYDVAAAGSFPDLTSYTLTGITMEEGDEKLHLTDRIYADADSVSSSASWSVSENDGEYYTADSTAVSDRKDALSSLSYDEFINYNAEDLSAYGLDAPRASLTWDYTYEQSVEVEKETEETEAGETETETESQSAEKTETETETGTAAETEGALSASISGSTEEAAAETETGTETETETETEVETEMITVADSVTLLIGDPIYAEPESETEEESGTESETTESETETAAETAETEGTSETESEGEIEAYYVKLSDSDEVYTMRADTLSDWLGGSLIDYVNRYLSQVPMTSMESLTVTYGGKEYELTVESEVQVVETEAETEAETGTEAESEAETETEAETEAETETEIVYKYKVNGRSKDETLFETFYGDAIAIQAQTLVEESDAEGTPDLSLVFKKLDGTEVSVDYYLGTDGMYTAVCDNGMIGKVNKRNVTDMIEDFEELVGLS